MSILLPVTLFVLSWFAATGSDNGQWPQFRGPQSIGVVEDPQLPDKWSATENVAWKTEVPGMG
ncbi:MAG TPA: serine/threonine protein kinase, partial [Blastocatellia bacterium]|nr:serine/threonine protein kinase [Blastocatellia bacterium]